MNIRTTVGGCLRPILTSRIKENFVLEVEGVMVE